MKSFITLLIAIILTGTANAQFKITDVSDTVKHKRSLSLGSGGIRYENGKRHKPHMVEVQMGMLDLGINTLGDKTDYTSAVAQKFLLVDNKYKNEDLFTLRTNKSINVNIYPFMLKVNLHNTDVQKWQFATGLGLQLYNFRFNKAVTFTNNPVPAVVVGPDSVSLIKNKLAMDYLMLPLMVNGKTRIGAGNSDTTGGKRAKNSLWLTYGVGVSGGYLISSWTKQISDQRGKEKNHDPFNLSQTNFCVNGELGIDGYIRLYASYQLTNLFKDGLDQHPICIGLRFLGL